MAIKKKTRSVEKPTPKKKTNIKASQVRKPIKEVEAPPVAVDMEFIHNLISAEVAIQLYENNKYEVNHILYNDGAWYSCSEDVKNIIDIMKARSMEITMEIVDRHKDDKKHLITGGIILSILTLALGLVL